MNKLPAEVIILSGNHPYYLSVASELAHAAYERGHIPLVIDASATTFVQTNLYNKVIGKVLHIPDYKQDFSSELLNMSGKIFELKSQRQIPDLADIDTTSPAITLLRDELPPKNKLRKLRKKLNQEYAQTYESLKSILVKLNLYQVDSVYIPNGRFPFQQASIDFFSKHFGNLYFYERGFAENQYYLKKFQTQNRKQVQEDFISWSSDCSENDIAKANAWLQSKKSGKLTQNDFGWIWKSNNNSKEKKPEIKKAVIFTSSEDEFVALGPEWHQHKWESQWDAISLVCEKLFDNNFEVSIRVHPNLANKSHRAFKRSNAYASALRKKFPKINIFNHDSSVNSYELASDADVIFVWDSTIGLELAALGKNVICLATSLYASPIHQPEALSLTQLNSIDLEHKFDNSAQATKFVAYLLGRDTPMKSDSSISGIYRETTGIRQAIALWLSAEKSIFKSLLRGLDLLRHRSFKSSIFLIRRKINL